ncbi:AraC family transcriptional regulator [Streptomyces umbrinus]|uniref:AraC family transcriptional regulator n=1 Tax=Streptomyces umbrinus TaxID=67370 RepID=UPI0016763D08|nr:AraC family transcriptional regulator [Streptomyces umbrinus]GHB82932.1 AraC family transcriptional regulator [Streptomyces umbrinus]
MTSEDMLRRHAVLESAGLDEFRATMASFLTPHRLAPTRNVEADMRSSVAVAPLGPVSLVYGSHSGTELDVDLTEQVDYYDVNLSWEGRNRITCGEDEVIVDSETAGIISPRMRVTMRLSDSYRQLHVRIERYALERHLEELLDRPVVAPIRFRQAMDLRAPAAATWARSVRLLVDDLETLDGLAAQPEGETPWTSFLMTGLLLGQPHNYTEQLAQRRAALRPGGLRRALDLIEEAPERDLSVERLAHLAGMSPRSLQRQFREYVGVTPREYVVQVRLARAHDDLRIARPGTITVADVALSWGFSHAPRFAAAYRRRYGELPSVTLNTS